MDQDSDDESLRGPPPSQSSSVAPGHPFGPSQNTQASQPPSTPSNIFNPSHAGSGAGSGGSIQGAVVQGLGPILLVPSSQPLGSQGGSTIPTATPAQMPRPLTINFSSLQTEFPMGGPNPGPTATQPIRPANRAAWHQDRARAASAERRILGSTHDGLDLPGHDVHPWQQGINGRLRRITWYSEYTPQLRDVMTMSDRLLGGSVQLWLGGRYDNGANAPVLETFISRLLWNTGYMPIIEGIVRLFENVILRSYSNDMTAFRGAQNEGTRPQTSHASQVQFDPLQFWKPENLILPSQAPAPPASEGPRTRSMTAAQRAASASTSSTGTGARSSATRPPIPSTPTPGSTKGKSPARRMLHRTASIEMIGGSGSSASRLPSSPFTLLGDGTSGSSSPSRTGSLAARLSLEGPRAMYGRTSEPVLPLPRVVTDVLIAWAMQVEVTDEEVLSTIEQELMHIYGFDPPRIWTDRVRTLMNDALEHSQAISEASRRAMREVFTHFVDDVVQAMQLEKLNAYYEGRA